MGNAADNFAKASAAVASISEILKGCGVQDVYLYGPRAEGTDDPGATWDFIIDLSRPINKIEFQTIHKNLLTAVQVQDSPAAKIYTTSPQYDRPSFTKWAVKSSKLIFSAP